MATLWETGAYVFRALGAKDQQSAGIATVAQILVLVAPICEDCHLGEQILIPMLTCVFAGVNAYAYMVNISPSITLYGAPETWF